MTTKIYTKTGDDGTTGLFGGERVSKDNYLICLEGEIDELNSFIGLSSINSSPELKEIFRSIQMMLFEIGAFIGAAKKAKMPNPVMDTDILQMEKHIDDMDAVLAQLKYFILPGGSIGAAHIHVARSVCRRVERLLVKTFPNEMILKYFNTLSDLLFTMARKENANRGFDSIIWRPRTNT